MLVIADRGFFSFEFWRDCLLTGADLLFRVAFGLRLPVTRVLPDGSYLSEVATHKARSSGFKIPLAAAADPRNATHIPVRVIEYTVTAAGVGGKPETFRLITTILDPDDVTAIELAAAYQLAPRPSGPARSRRRRDMQKDPHVRWLRSGHTCRHRRPPPKQARCDPRGDGMETGLLRKGKIMQCPGWGLTSERSTRSLPGYLAGRAEPLHTADGGVGAAGCGERVEADA